MEVGTVLSVVQTLFAALSCPELRVVFSVLGYKSELDSLERTVNTIKAVFLDVEAKAGHVDLSHQAQLFIEELKDAVYDADDLFDEFVTKAEHQHKKLLKEGADEVSEKVHRFFTRIKDLPDAYKMSQGVKDIRKKLDAIANNHNKFGFKLDCKPICKRREETCSYVYSQDVIGRDDDRDKIVGRLLDPNVRADVSFLTIVGMGGMGKTTLAQLIYNDDRITKEFPTRIWVCVGDEDSNHLDVKAVLTKMLGSVTAGEHDKSTKEWLQRKIREQLAGQKYLLILDDIWNENRIEWLGLENFLKEGQSGSWVVVTTRSTSTASIVGDGCSYKLEGLSDANAWKLFDRAAFGPREGQATQPGLIEMGKKIVKKCANVPLAIRVVGSLLYGKGEDKWSSFERNRLAEVDPKINNLFLILKFSYQQLESSLKSCFSYCALFPKGYKINKEMLIHLWMAQGFIVPLEENQNIEDAAEEHFLTLLRRCFFQDVEKDKYEQIISFKLHDLMHDVAQQVSKTEVRVVDHITGGLDKKIRHLSVAKYMAAIGPYNRSAVRTLLRLHGNNDGIPVGPLVDNWMSLRALDLSRSRIKSLQNKIGSLQHLRYLDLSGNTMMKVLPKSFTKLRNLETLILQGCDSLRELPTDLCKLVKLRCLDIGGCRGITDMPADMGKLSCLQKLTNYVVNLSNLDYGNQLEGLQFLTKIKGCIEIRIHSCGNNKYEKGKSGELRGGYLMNKKHLCSVAFIFELNSDGDDRYGEIALMDEIQPHHDLKWLRFKGYEGKKLPSWAIGNKFSDSLPNLVEIDICHCIGLVYLAPMGKLPHLKTLRLVRLTRLQYIEEKGNRQVMVGGQTVEDSLFFPSLEVLELWELEKLKGWWREEEDEAGFVKDSEEAEDSHRSRRRREAQPLPSFPLVSELKIVGCQKLAITIAVPNVEHVRLYGVNGKLRVRGEVKAAVDIEQRETYNSSRGDKSRKVTTTDVGCITLLSSITQLQIEADSEVERLEEVREMWQSYRSSLRELVIYNCKKLERIVKGGLEHLSALEELKILHCPQVTLEVSDDGATYDHPSSSSSSQTILPSLCSLHIEDCSSIESLPKWMPHLTALKTLKIGYCPNLIPTITQQPFSCPLALRDLKLRNLPKVLNLPQWMQHLTFLHTLTVEHCYALKSMPHWMSLLTSLAHLNLICCSKELEQRCCKSPPGQDWSHICHIPNLKFSR